MKLQSAQLKSNLQKNLAAVYVLSGDEPLQMGELADDIRNAARNNGYANREIMEVNAKFNWDNLAQEADSLSLFAEKKIIDLRIPGGKPGREGGAALAGYCQNLPPDTLLLVTLPKLDRSQQNSKWFKALDSAGVTVQVWPVDTGRLPAWVRQRMLASGLTPGPEVAEMLAEQVEGNLLAARQEIEKLLLLYGPGNISVDQLRGMIADSAKFDVFTLVDSALSGNSKRCVRILAGLEAEGTPPPVVLWALSREIRNMNIMADEMKRGASADQAASKAGVWNNRKGLVKQGLQRISPQKWQQLLSGCQQADAAIKGVSKESPWMLFEQLTLGICGLKTSP